MSKKKKTKQNRLCTCNIPFRRVVQPLLQWAVNKYYTGPFWVSVYSVRYLACSAHAPYFHLWPLQLYNIFSTLSQKRHDFRKNVIEHKMCVLIFSTTFVWNFSQFRKNSARYDKKCKRVWSPCKLKAILVRFQRNFEFTKHLFFRNILKHKISWKPVQYEPICSMRTDGRMDRQIWRSWQSLSASLRKAPNTYVDKAPKVQPTSSESTPCTSKYARCRQPTARIAVSSGPPSHSSHNTKTFQQFILFAISYRVSYRFPCRCSYLSSNVGCFLAVLVTNISPTVTNSPSCINLLAAKILPLKVNSSITMLAVPCSPRTRKHRAIGCISL